MPKGFFNATRKKIQKKVETQKVGCTSCGLYTKCNTPKMDVGGLGEKKILIITDYTTKGEDQTGRHFSNLSHKYMIEEFANFDIDVAKDCWKIAAIRCAPEFNKKGEIPPIYINACRNKLLTTIKELKPEKIIVMGKIALQTLIGHRVTARLSVANYERWTGWAIPDQELETLIYPIFNPTFVIEPLMERKRKMKKSGWYKEEAGPIWEHSKLSKTDDFVVRKLFYRRQIKRLASKRKFRKHNYKTECSIINHVEDAIKLLKQLKKEKNILAFDFEATGIKLDRDGHRLLTVSFSNGMFSWGMPFFDNTEFRQLFKSIMLDPNIGLIAHNAKYEWKSTFVMLGYWPVKLIADPMLGAHILRNTTGITGLKFLSMVMLGEIYDNDVEQYMTAIEEEDEKNNNSFNRLSEAPIDMVCLYNAIDSHFTYKIYELQAAQFIEDPFLQRGYELFLNATPVLAEVEQRGIKVDEYRLLLNERKLDNTLLKIKHNIENCDEVKEWYKVKKEQFKFTSSQQLGEFLFKILKFVPTKFTQTGQPSTDSDALEELKSKSLFVKYLLGYKKVYKMRHTFLAGIKRETINGVIRPGYNLNSVSSFRTSSSGINFQNLPHHDKWSNKIIRSVFVPRDGYTLIECDYGALEFSVAAMLSKCKGMLAALFNPDFDMHRASAADIFMISEEEVTKRQRQQTKGYLTFSVLYGSGPTLVANNFWDAFSIEDKAHLATKGIKNFDDFFIRVKEAHRIFWEERFKGQFDWREKTWKKYIKTGEVVYPTGFKIRDIGSRNMLLNAPSQGSGSNFLIYGLTELHHILKKSKTDAYIVAQIHDSCMLEVRTDLIDKVLRMVKLSFVTKVMDKYPMSRIGLSMEADIYNNNWYELSGTLKICKREPAPGIMKELGFNVEAFNT